jgi:hypothetical protein
MPRDLDLKARLERFGLDVVEVDGWRTRGSATFTPGGSVHHHTAGSIKGHAPSLGIVVNGRSDLPGPLCNVLGPREESMRVYLVAAGRANHAGKGGWGGLSGNSSVYGLEEEHTGGPNEPVSELRIDRMARVHAAFASGRFDASMVCQHREWAPGRKPDFIAKFIDKDDFRRRVADHLAHPSEEDDDMPVYVIHPAYDSNGEGIVLLQGGKLSAVADVAGLGGPFKTWDLRKSPNTWRALVRAVGGVSPA